MKIYIVLFSLFLIACSDRSDELNADYGSPQVRDRMVESDSPLGETYLSEVKPILDQRCVVCHSCYDAPCQLKLSSAEGIDRGFSPEHVYATRYFETDPTRLFIDAANTQQWRDKLLPFSPVLNEREQTPDANLEGSLLYQLLLQKNTYPLPEDKILSDSFDVSINRDQTCTSIETLEGYQDNYPLAGMPYGLPNITKSEFKTLESWIEKGAPMAQPKAIPASIKERIDEWEVLLNGGSNKSKLIGRYIYEHLILGHLYFSEEPLNKGESPIYFRLVRSLTPSGQPIEEIATRRPFDDPMVAQFYYRLRRDTGTVVSKMHMPYPLNMARKQRWLSLFYDNPFEVNELPKYQKDDNPFIVFAQIPSELRYGFMLDEAEFTIMGFTKGPVCRGQVAVDVIRDKFWVFFTNPTSEYIDPKRYDAFIYQQANNLQLPSVESSNELALPTWKKYSQLQLSYYDGLKSALAGLENADLYIGIDSLYKNNANAGLTVFRNFDSAVIVKGLQGKQPKTAWVINYPILERIHYLLVAGFDIYGSIKHQLVTRLYMDFLRIESEMLFVTLLPEYLRSPEMVSWYIDCVKDLEDYINEGNFFFDEMNSVKYETTDPKQELFNRLKQRYLSGLTEQEVEKLNITINSGGVNALNYLPNPAVQQLGQTSFILVEDDQQAELYTILRHNAHNNVSSLLSEEDMRVPELDEAEIFKGLVGSYPQVIFRVNAAQTPAFIEQFIQVNDAVSYEKLLDNFAIRRTHPDFWKVSDRLHALHLESDPVNYGILDYNRLENR